MTQSTPLSNNSAANYIPVTSITISHRNSRILRKRNGAIVYEPEPVYKIIFTNQVQGTTNFHSISSDLTCICQKQ